MIVPIFLDIINIWDFEEPKCLYCNNKLIIYNTSRYNSSLDNYKCMSNDLNSKDLDYFCLEEFEFYHRDDVLEHIYFTCNNLAVTIYADSNIYYLCYKDAETSTIKVPKFKIDFSDKQKLAEKLNSYIIFS